MLHRRQPFFQLEREKYIRQDVIIHKWGKEKMRKKRNPLGQFVIGMIILASIISNLQFVFRGVSLYVYLVMLILIFGGQRPCGTGLIPLAEG